MTNPLLHPSSLPYQLPPFAEIKVEHYRPAFDEALARHDAELTAITENTAAPTWENTVEALERSGQDLDRVMSVFGNLSGTDVTDEMEEIAADIYPRLSAHYDAMYQDEKLYQRIKDATPPAGDEEGTRLHEHLLRTFARQGADLDAAGKARLSDINQRLSALSEEFGRNLMASTRERAVEFTEEELEGLPPERIASAKADAKALGREGYVIPLELPTVQSEQSRLAQEGRGESSMRHRQAGAPKTTFQGLSRPSNCAPSAPSCWAMPPTPITSSQKKPQAAPKPRATCSQTSPPLPRPMPPANTSY